MRSKLMAATAVVASVIFGSLGALAQGAPGNLGVSVDLREEVRDSFIFVFFDDVASTDVRGQANRLVRGQGGSLTFVYTTALKGFAAKMPADAAARLAARNPNIDYYEPDGVVFAFPRPPWAGGGDDTDDIASCDPQVIPWGISRVGGPGDGLATGMGMAWVIDTGIDFNHADLNVDVGRSANFVRRGKDSAKDGHGHGTHVAGTIAAINNECDVVGVAAGATVVAVRVLDNSGSGSYSGVIAGIDYVAANAVDGDVANLSLGGPYSDALNQAVQTAAAYVPFALAAGNSSDDADNYSPASANHDNIYTVSAIDSYDDFAWFSNYGNPPIDCAAPGVGVLSTRKGGGTTTFSGTSMSAPHVAGLLLLGGPDFVGYVTGDPDGNADPICHR